MEFLGETRNLDKKLGIEGQMGLPNDVQAALKSVLTDLGVTDAQLRERYNRYIDDRVGLGEEIGATLQVQDGFDCYSWQKIADMLTGAYVSKSAVGRPKFMCSLWLIKNVLFETYEGCPNVELALEAANKDPYLNRLALSLQDEKDDGGETATPNADHFEFFRGQTILYALSMPGLADETHGEDETPVGVVGYFDIPNSRALKVRNGIAYYIGSETGKLTRNGSWDSNSVHIDIEYGVMLRYALTRPTVRGEETVRGVMELTQAKPAKDGFACSSTVCAFRGNLRDFDGDKTHSPGELYGEMISTPETEAEALLQELGARLIDRLR